MKATVTRSCGHAETIDIIGSSRDREKVVEAQQARECRACYDANHKATGVNLPPLAGTPKQIAWAEKIRNAYVERGGQDNLKQISASWWIDRRERLKRAA